MSEKKVYLNWKGPRGRETVDVVIRSELKLSPRDFSREVARLCSEYAMSGMNVYPSSRCCAGWDQ
jgi:hypothetical protein